MTEVVCKNKIVDMYRLQIPKCEVLLVFLVFSCTLNIFGFQIVCQTKQEF